MSVSSWRRCTGAPRRCSRFSRRLDRSWALKMSFKASRALFPESKLYFRMRQSSKTTTIKSGTGSKSPMMLFMMLMTCWVNSSLKLRGEEQRVGIKSKKRVFWPSRRIKNIYILWKYGDGMHCLDTFRIWEVNVAKAEIGGRWSKTAQIRRFKCIAGG
ncbi:uncharacterized protein LOC111988772 isoform X1 [Quercus suber]|uniref:uncharacterized protein LOC111988772 isoform X1 n=1 Tax=Quercus suber TaxID=58331 RepID=UPI0032DFC8A8